MSSHKSIEDIDKEIAELSEAIEQLENGSWKIETQKMGEPRIDMSKFQAEQYKRIIKYLQAYKERLEAE
ncbi:prefoldin subunit 5 [Ochrobactrum sp. P6BSIII]|uniref:hypothetical protein n=1 Tax=unclassified Ochrobactrum TaxID=239106 RepID=UPI00111770AC|nr:prefoldin subunit 5 [Ochrobactrum sp. P6BSIII]